VDQCAKVTLNCIGRAGPGERRRATNVSDGEFDLLVRALNAVNPFRLLHAPERRRREPRGAGSCGAAERTGRRPAPADERRAVEGPGQRPHGA